MDSAATQAGPDGSLSSEGGVAPEDAFHQDPSALPRALIRDLWCKSGGERLGLSEAAFVGVLLRVGSKYNHGALPGEPAGAAQHEAFYRSLHSRDLALAHACAKGYEAAWQVFFDQYKSALTRAAVAMTHSSALGEELAGSLYGELFGLFERDGVRRSPLESYSGRGSLMGWLRTMLAQRQVDHHRRTHRETAMEQDDFAAMAPEAIPASGELSKLDRAVATLLRSLAPEDRFLLSSYFLDGTTLLAISRLLHVHEATVSRKLKRLTVDLRKRLLNELVRAGMSRRAAEEALGTDPRDLSVNLRKLLQASVHSTFSPQEASAS